MGYVIAVSAPVGGGKSSLASGLARRLQDACAIYFDSYETLSERPVEEIKQWMQGGARINELVIPDLPEDIARLKRGESVRDPLTGEAVEAGRYIFFETPFARQHQATGSLIDLSIWIDTPLDIALARNIREFTGRPEMYQEFIPWLRGYLDNYLEFVGDLLRMQQEVVGSAADIILDGRTDLDANLERAEREIRSRLG